MKTSAAPARFKIPQDRPESGRVWRDHVNRMDDNRLAGISKNGKASIWMASETLMRRLNIASASEQTHWIRYKTWSHKKLKMKKKKKKKTKGKGTFPECARANDGRYGGGQFESS